MYGPDLKSIVQSVSTQSSNLCHCGSSPHDLEWAMYPLACDRVSTVSACPSQHPPPCLTVSTRRSFERIKTPHVTLQGGSYPGG